MALAHFQRTFADLSGNVQSGIFVTITKESDGSPAALFSDTGGVSSKPNPFTTSLSGYADFYVDTGRYRIQAPGIDWRYVDIIGQPDAPVDTSDLVIRATSVAEIEAYSVPTGYVFSLNASGRSGTFDVVAGDFSTELAADTLNGVYIGLADNPTATTKVAKRRYSQAPKLEWFGAAFDGTDESAIAIAMLSITDELNTDKGQRLTAKGIEFSSYQKANIKGSIALPNGAVDFDKILFGYNCDSLEIYVNDIDGNRAGQSGTLGTHLFYFIDCSNSTIKIGNAFDHYIVPGGFVGSTDSGNRDASTGAIYFKRGDKIDLTVGLLTGWGREGIYLNECTDSDVTVGHCQSLEDGEYSGVQVSGSGNRLHRASVDKALASAVGFDTVGGTISNIITTNTKENTGLNFGHPGFPASNSVASNIVIDKAFNRGIQVSASTQNLKISNFSIKNSGGFGIGISDGSNNIALTGGSIQNSENSNILTSAADVFGSNVKLDELDVLSIRLSSVSGVFTDGETVSSASGSGVVRTSISNSTGLKHVVFLDSFTGSFPATETLTGATSAATGTIDSTSVPNELLEQSGGVYSTEDRNTGGGDYLQYRFKNGSAMAKIQESVTIATGGARESFTFNFPSSFLWSAAPTSTASLTSAAGTANYTVDHVEVNATTTALTFTIKTSVAQTLGVSFMFMGIWK